MADVILISMPWVPFSTPSIQLGILKSVLDKEGIPTETAHLYVEFAALLRVRGLAPAGLHELEHMAPLLGDWVFAGPPFRNDAALPLSLRALAEAKPELTRALQLAERVREAVPEFLDRCAEDVLRDHPRVVGFSSSYIQNVASLALAKVLRHRSPGLHIVLGGGNCIGGMGRALLEAYPWIDVVVHGEAELVAPALFARLCSDQRPSQLSGVSFRDTDGLHLAAEETDTVPMNAVPTPNYDEYFARVNRTAAREVVRTPSLLLESSRGCWWADQSTCSFCSATSGGPRYRRKEPSQVVQDLTSLVQRHGRRAVCFVDNIMSADAHRDLFPLIRDAGVGAPLFVEAKVNLTRNQLEVMRDAGVFMIQPGIESLYTPILRLIRKGTSALQNIRFLKWATELGIRAYWNLVYGFPGEPIDAYDLMADLIPLLAHLQPPNPPIPLRLDRFSPYHANPGSHGLQIHGPARMDSAVYGDVPNLNAIASHFRFSYVDGRRPEEYTIRFRKACTDWSLAWTGAPPPRLASREVSGGLEIVDTRFALERRTTLNLVEAGILAACASGATAVEVEAAVTARTHLDPGKVPWMLGKLEGARLIFREGPRYLSLVMPETSRPGGSGGLSAKHG